MSILFPTFSSENGNKNNDTSSNKNESESITNQNDNASTEDVLKMSNATAVGGRGK